MFAFATYPRSRVFKNAGNSVARPWVSKMQELTFSIADYGASPARDNTNAIKRAYASLKRRSGGGILSLPGGVWPFSSFPLIDGHGIIVKGAGRRAFPGFSGSGLGTIGDAGTLLVPLNTTGDDIVVQGEFCRLEDFSIRPTVRKTDGYAIKFVQNAYWSSYARLHLMNVYNGINIAGGGELHGTDLHIRYILGNVGLRVGGVQGVSSPGGVWKTHAMDNGFPTAVTGHPKTWAQSTAFAVGDIVQTNDRIYQCVVAGTSAGAGTGPSGLPSGNTAQDAFQNTITDGTVQWKFVSQKIIWTLLDSYIGTIRLDEHICLNGWNGLVMVDNAGQGVSSYPRWVSCYDLETDHSFEDGIKLVNGTGFLMSNSWPGASQNGHGVHIESTFAGNVNISTSKIGGNAFHGVLLGSGPRFVTITASSIQSNSSKTSGANDGFRAEAGADDFVVQGCHLGFDPEIGSSQQNYGARVEAGNSDRYIIADNLVSGNVTGGVLDGGTGVNKRVANNY